MEVIIQTLVDFVPANLQNNVISIISNRKQCKMLPIFLIFIGLPYTFCSAQQTSIALDAIHQLNPEDDYGNMDLYDSLFTHYKKTKNYSQLGSDAHQLAKWLSREGQLEKTIEVLKIGIEARKNAVPFNPELLKRSYANLGKNHNLKKDYDKAIKAYQDMINVEENTIFNEIAYVRLGRIYKKLEDPYKALTSFSKAFKFFNPKKDKEKIIKNHFEISKVHRSLIYYGYQEKDSNSYNALKHLITADSLISSYPEPTSENLFTINLELGVFYFSANTPPNPEKALFYFEKALKYSKEIDNKRYIAGCYINIGQTYLLLEQFEKSEQYFFKALEVINNNQYLRGISFLGLASIESKKENYEQAQEYYQKSLANILKVERDKNWTPKIKDLKNSNHKDEILELFHFSAVDYLEQNKINRDPKIYDTFLKTIKSGDSLVDYIILENFSYRTKLKTRDIGSEFHNLGLEACYQTNNLRDAFYFMEKSKAVLLMQDINDQITSLPTSVLSKKVNYEDDIKNLQNNVLIAVDKEKDSLVSLIKTKKEQFNRFKDSISLEFPQYFSAKKVPEILPLSKVSVPENEATIQYSMAERTAGALPHAYMMVLTNKDQKLFKVPNVKELIEDIKILRRLLNQPFKTSEDITTYKQTAHNIYKTLFPNEIRTTLQNKKVTIIPDHMLGMIPFEALITDLDKSTYLIEESEINYAFSLTFQEKNATINRAADQDFLGIAPVNFTAELTPLKNSTKEIAYANDLYDGTLLLDKEATKENFIKRIKDYKILHLATHADASDSIAPWIAFRNSKLTDLELNSLQSQAELVVLSACNTSLGKISRGEGILSLARGFFKSGANTVIPSLWSTNDKATATITSDFYKNLSEGQTKSAALRTAKLNYLKNNNDAEASPHYWASLVLIGDSGTLLPQTNNLLYLWIGLGLVFLTLFIYLFKTQKKKSIL
ncbi:CHAT domain-containing protein [Aquimarina sp. SS2-1]|uniref:CHAT domain-containing protein n=1 Tax=Aquimarina besae TaxID=3342247 RepID=UPI00366D16FD